MPSSAFRAPGIRAGGVRSRRTLLLGREADGDGAQAPRAIAAIGPDCLAFRGVACMSCRDACAASAIRFVLARGGAQPRIDPELCTGCADCAAICPAASIVLQNAALPHGGAHG
jgi:ferredoxin-type protein NapF